jgi:hypothetical protein
MASAQVLTPLYKDFGGVLLPCGRIPMVIEMQRPILDLEVYLSPVLWPLELS